MVSDRDHSVADSAERIFADLADPQTILRAQDDGWEDRLWRALEQNGLTLAWGAEGHGGAGASLAEGFDVAMAAGRFALSAPLTETMLAGWLLSQAQIASPAGRMSL